MSKKLNNGQACFDKIQERISEINSLINEARDVGFIVSFQIEHMPFGKVQVYNAMNVLEVYNARFDTRQR